MNICGGQGSDTADFRDKSVLMPNVVYFEYRIAASKNIRQLFFHVIFKKYSFDNLAKLRLSVLYVSCK